MILRSTIARGAAALTLAIAVGVSTGIAAQAPESASTPYAGNIRPTQNLTVGELPDVQYGGEVTQRARMSWNPTGEWNFPTVFHAGKYLKNPKAQWYLYAAPHENPGGVALFYSNSLSGPWTQHKTPVIRNNWPGAYSASHVSSPDVIWSSKERVAFMYFHGPNSRTRYATSTDGINWRYGGEAVTIGMTKGGATEASYARVFPNPDSKATYPYLMFFMDNTAGDQRRIRLALSKDLRKWYVRETPFMNAMGGEGKDLSGADLWEHKGELYVVYHNDPNGVIRARLTNRALTYTGEPMILHSPSGKGVDRSRAGAPEIVTDPKTGRTFVFWEAGPRLRTTIAWGELK